MYNSNIYFSSYKKIYNDNKHFVIHESVFLLYETMYNGNNYCQIIREYTMTTNISLIHESVFLIIQDDV